MYHLSEDVPRMFRYPRYQSLKRGFTLIETLMGMVSCIIIVTVLVSLFQAGMKTFIYTWRQTSVFTNVRKMYEGDGPAEGFLWSSRSATSLRDLSTSALNLNAADGSQPTFTLSQGNLTRTLLGKTTILGTNVTTFTPTYYNLDALGHIMISTSTDVANFAAMYIQTQVPAKKTFSFYSGGRLRNHS